ncbi:MAG: aryl-sulfate sulfotransferase [Promethearchaeota archaeon]
MANSKEILLKNTFNYRNSQSRVSSLDDAIMNITILGDYFKGYNLFELTEINLDKEKKRTLLITSTEGDIIAEMKDYMHPAKFITSDTVLCAKKIGNKEANAVLWNVQNNDVQILDFFGHHDFEWNPNNDTFFAFLKYRIEIDGQEYMYDTINEYTRSGELVWSLDTHSFIKPNYWCPFQDMDSGIADITHSNSIFFDAEEDVIYYNPRNPNTFYKIDHKTGKIIWGLGEYGNFSLFDLDGNQKESLFYHPHALEKVDDNTFIIFDNNFHNQIGSFSGHNRMLEITIDEMTMTANESWSWVAPREYYSAVICDADRLPNGNHLGTFGMNSHPNTNLGARIVEVNDTGHIVWEMNFPNTEETSYRIYHVDRFRFNPIVSSIPDITYKEKNLVVTWQTWYYFRTNRQVTESYTIYLDDNPIYFGEHIFDKFWRPKNLTVNLGSLDLRNQNLKIGFPNLQNPTSRSTFGFDLIIMIGVLIVNNILRRRRKKVRLWRKYLQ